MAKRIIPIAVLRLLDIPLPDTPRAKVHCMGQAKDLIRAHKTAALVHGIDLMHFHNKAIVYSGIQVSTYKGCVEWTAIGEEAVDALLFWYQLYELQHPIHTQNKVLIQESYQPSFTDKPKSYQIDAFLISDELAQALQHIHTPKERKERLEKYIYGNLQTFFQYIGYSYDKNLHFLKVEVLKSVRYQKALPIFHYHKKAALGITFQCNFRLPQSLRIGQSTALGYGKVEHV